MARPKSEKVMLPRSYRVEQSIYAAARARAAREGTNLNLVVGDLVEGYARGVYELPERKIVRKFPTK